MVPQPFWCEASLSAGVDLREAVKKPADEELNDWIAVHVVDFYNRINLIYGTICDRCTAETCPRMTGGKKFEYHWRDNNRYRKPTPVSAPEYIGLLMDWIDEQINDPVLFPTSMDVPFPKNYRSAVKKIMSRLYRVFAHCLNLLIKEAHVNVCYKHFYYFVTCFDLIDPKELEPLVSSLPDLVYYLLSSRNPNHGYFFSDITNLIQLFITLYSHTSMRTLKS
ncbi:unnamed protein product [Schistocephalus solidus]|uniref:MOB kinase activator-like 2 n=1 Tax=Schistocephalus solidus TaxID=70667 RepID=A0A183SMP5_SCHSO|nr:unnamed protein product [Schistocephalus solidus]